MMFILWLSLSATLAIAEPYYECFEHSMCEGVHHYHDEGKIYCYHGTCTARCPPGYTQVNIKEGRNFTCECNTEKGMKFVKYFGDPFASLNNSICECDETYCIVTVYTTGIGYNDGLVPKGSPPNCKVDLDNIPGVVTEFAFYLVLATMIIFMYINCRSASGIIYDFHRYFGLYVLGSMMVIVFVNTVTPFTAGFTRSMGFGIIAHNSAEWNILLRLHFGKTAYARNTSNVILIIYYIVMLLAVVVLHLEQLLYFSMVQGGFLDWTLLFFTVAGSKTIKHTENFEIVFGDCCHTAYSRFIFWFGFGALFHLTSVEILFAGFTLNNAVVIGAGGFFLLPMFLCYTIWVFGQERFMVFCGPSLFMDYNKNYKDDEDRLLVPFKHSTRAVDILWNKVMGVDDRVPKNDLDSAWQKLKRKGEAGTFNLEMQSVEVHGVGGGDDTPASMIVLEDCRKKMFRVDDCESFKFGIHTETYKPLKCCCSYCSWIPCYWIAAFICVCINAGLLIFLPQLFPAKKGKEGYAECNEGYVYGTW